MPTSDSTPKERLKYFHQLPLPSKWEMEKELATRFLSLGVTRSALEIFSRLEMWEDAVGCLQRLEKEEEAEKIVRDLLEGRKIDSDLVHVMKRNNLSEGRLQKLTSAREAKLWCLLGDLALESFNATKDPEDAKKVAIGHYEKAWEVSGHTSSRAMRSMGSLKFGLGDWEASLPCLRHAVEINPLYSRVWFTMGVSYVKLEKWSDARDAFRRLVNVDEEDAEGWNNLAAVYLRMGEEGLSKDDVSPTPRTGRCSS
jgi:tetratricopeptide (TPR) repeat protein